MANNKDNVTVGKPRVGGAVYIAPIGTTLPTNATDDLSSVFKCLGYISDDGLEVEDERETEEINAWGGDIVAILNKSYKTTFKLKFIEVLNVDVLKVVYGESNVTVGDDGMITIKGNNATLSEYVWVLDTITLNNRARRDVYPCGKVSEVGATNYKDDELVGFESTITGMADTEGNSKYTYIQGATSSTSSSTKETTTEETTE